MKNYLPNWKKIKKVLQEYHNDICCLLFGLCLILNLCDAIGDVHKIIFGIIAVFFSVNWLRSEVRELREEIKKLK